MKKQIDHFLLGLLWLLATALTASFWFNTRFGFNIFSAPHWKYLGQIQASGTAINTLFYTSMVLSLVIMIVGLYLLVRPKFRKINFNPVISVDEIKTVPTAPVINIPETNEVTPVSAAEIKITSTETFLRPPRLNLSKTNEYASALTGPVAPVSAPLVMNTPIPVAPEQNDYSKELSEIFQSKGYVVKTPQKIKKIKPSLLAVGTDEVLWIGATDVDANDFNKLIELLRSTFTETLEDIEIKVNPFIITKNQIADLPAGINVYSSVSDLKQAIPENRKLDTGEQEDFDAYSEYIDTVVGYLNNF